MELECDCTNITIDEWNQKMKDTKPISYKWLVGKIRKHLPRLYDALYLEAYNPWENDCCSNKEYYILVHSGIEYFIRKH